MTDFDSWFDDLVTRAYHLGIETLINAEEKESYREYFDDKNTFDEVIEMESLVKRRM